MNHKYMILRHLGFRKVFGMTNELAGRGVFIMTPGPRRKGRKKSAKRNIAETAESQPLSPTAEILNPPIN